MKIGIISDTHMSAPDEDLFFLSEEVFKDINIICHCGDMVSLNVLDAFYSREIFGVSGNMDGMDVRRNFNIVNFLDIQGIKITILHGIGYGTDKEYSLIKEFPDTDIFLTGHTHVPEIKRVNNYFFMNPGSFSYNRIKYPTRSAGVLEIDEGRIKKLELLDLENIKTKKIKTLEELNV